MYGKLEGGKQLHCSCRRRLQCCALSGLQQQLLLQACLGRRASHCALTGLGRAQAALLEVRAAWQGTAQQLQQRDAVQVAQVAQAVQQLRADLQQQLPSGKLKAIESKLAALEGSVLSAGKSSAIPLPRIPSFGECSLLKPSLTEAIASADHREPGGQPRGLDADRMSDMEHAQCGLPS